jgi:hypothetical protein
MVVANPALQIVLDLVVTAQTQALQIGVLAEAGRRVLVLAPILAEMAPAAS